MTLKRRFMSRISQNQTLKQCKKEGKNAAKGVKTQSSTFCFGIFLIIRNSPQN